MNRVAPLIPLANVQFVAIILGMIWVKLRKHVGHVIGEPSRRMSMNFGEGEHLL